MTGASLLGTYAWGGPCGSAILKETAEDFQVDEVLDIPLSGEGEHLWLWVEKRALNTEEAARLLARTAGIPLWQVSYAGLKDRQALTRQWFSLHLPGRTDPDLEALDSSRLRVCRRVRHQRKLQRGAHAANRFLLRLTHLQADRAALEERLDTIAARGVPNYFGLQRFGHQEGNLAEARCWAAQGRIPEQRILRSRLLSAARSYLFNQVLSARVSAGSWNKALPGDLLSFTDSHSFFLADAASCSDPRLAILDLHPTGPLCGQGLSQLQDVPLQLEQQIWQANPQLVAWLATAGLKQERRILRLPVRELTWHHESAVLQLAFVLPAGCFATAVVRELVQLPDQAS